MRELLPQVSFDLPGPGPGPGAQLDLAALFTPFTSKPREVWLEIGFGGGEHLAWQAEQHPNVGLLGAEYFINGIASLLRRVHDREIGNLRVYQGDGRDLLDALPEACLGRVFLLFSDPWPKLRHHKRRVIQEATIGQLARIMADGAELRLATDDMDYLKWILERMIRHPDFEWLAQGPADWRVRPPDWPPTRYEIKALEQGRRPVYLRFRRRSRGADRP